MEFECHKKSILSQRRCCGSEYKTNEYYLKSSRMEADRLINIGLNANTSILDIGCAQGRLAIGLLDKIGEMRYYRGVDVQKHSITWCKEFITKKHPFDNFLIKYLAFPQLLSIIKVKPSFSCTVFLYSLSLFLLSSKEKTELS